MSNARLGQPHHAAALGRLSTANMATAGSAIIDAVITFS
jgi:hypothetical protein